MEGKWASRQYLLFALAAAALGTAGAAGVKAIFAAVVTDAITALMCNNSVLPVTLAQSCSSVRVFICHIHLVINLVFITMCNQYNSLESLRQQYLCFWTTNHRITHANIVHYI
mgnify:FL=1